MQLTIKLIAVSNLSIVDVPLFFLNFTCKHCVTLTHLIVVKIKGYILRTFFVTKTRRGRATKATPDLKEDVFDVVNEPKSPKARRNYKRK